MRRLERAETGVSVNTSIVAAIEWAPASRIQVIAGITTFPVWQKFGKLEPGNLGKGVQQKCVLPT